jgi:hypothetical protein
MPRATAAGEASCAPAARRTRSRHCHGEDSRPAGIRSCRLREGRQRSPRCSCLCRPSTNPPSPTPPRTPRYAPESRRESPLERVLRAPSPPFQDITQARSYAARRPAATRGAAAARESPVDAQRHACKKPTALQGAWRQLPGPDQRRLAGLGPAQESGDLLRRAALVEASGSAGPWATTSPQPARVRVPRPVVIASTGVRPPRMRNTAKHPEPARRAPLRVRISTNAT